MQVKDFVKVYDNTLPQHVLSNLIRVINTFQFEEATIDQGQKDFNVRRTYNKGLSNLSESMTEVHWFNLLKSNFQSHLERYFNDIKYILPSNFNNIVDVQILKYTNSGFYQYHTDHYESAPRTMTCLLLLNNDYEGGELCFVDPNGENEWCIEKAPARMVIFPSNFMFPHTVKPVKGKRISIVGWSL